MELSTCTGCQREIIFCTDGGVSSMEEDRIKSLVKSSATGGLAPVKKVQLRSNPCPVPSSVCTVIRMYWRL
jgi:hypothetical protein